MAHKATGYRATRRDATNADIHDGAPCTCIIYLSCRHLFAVPGLEGNDRGKATSGNVSERDRAMPSSLRDDDEGVPPFFVGEDVGNSSFAGVSGQQGSDAHAVIPRVSG